MNLDARARIALLPAILAVSSAALFVRFADTPPLATAFWRGAIAGIAFLPVFLIPRFRREFRELTWRRIGQIAAATTVICVHQICFITSLSYTSIAASTFLTCTQPIWTAFFGGFLIKERVGLRSWLMILGAIAGMIVIITDRPDPGDPLLESSLFGNLLAVAAAILAALFSLAARRLRQSTPLVPFMTTVHASGTIFLGSLLIIFQIPVAGYSAASWTGLLLLGLLPTFIGHSLLTFSVGYLPAFVVSSSLLGEPVGATILGALFLGEVPGLQTIIGGAIIVLFILCIVLKGGVAPLPEPLRE